MENFVQCYGSILFRYNPYEKTTMTELYKRALLHLALGVVVYLQFLSALQITVYKMKI